MLEDILPKALFNDLIAVAPHKLLTEVRLRTNKPVYYAINGIYRKLVRDDISYKASASDINYVIAMASKNSLYACNDTIVNGYIACEGGLRVGLVGEGIIKNNTLSAVKYFNSICIRIPHAIVIQNTKIDKILKDFDNTLIISRPGLGKTTLLRDMIRRLSDDKYNVLVLDERYELSGMSYGISAVDLGECSDIVVGVPKINAYSTLVRTMRPDIVATDEIFGASEVDAINDAIRCGVKVVATLHCNDIQKLANDQIYKKLLETMRYIVCITGIGLIDKIYDRKCEK